MSLPVLTVPVSTVHVPLNFVFLFFYLYMAWTPTLWCGGPWYIYVYVFIVNFFSSSLPLPLCVFSVISAINCLPHCIILSSPISVSCFCSVLSIAIVNKNKNKINKAPTSPLPPAYYRTSLSPW